MILKLIEARITKDMIWTFSFYNISSHTNTLNEKQFEQRVLNRKACLNLEMISQCMLFVKNSV